MNSLTLWRRKKIASHHFHFLSQCSPFFWTLCRSALSILLALAALAAGAEIDSRGPIESVGMRVVVAPGRVEAPDFAFHPKDIPPRPGKAGWIGLDPVRYPDALPPAALLRREIELPSAPRLARVWFSADAHARLYVNGRLAARGPDDGGQDYPGQQTGKWFVNFRDLTPFFRKGRNVISAEVFSAEAMAGRYNTTGKSGFLFEAAITLPDGKTRELMSDAGWRGIPGPCWKFADWRPSNGGQAVRCLHFDAQAEPQNWRLPGFDDHDWPACVPVPTRWPQLVNSEIPPRLEAVYPIQAIVRPTANVQIKGHQITFHGDGGCAVRYDHVLSGFISLKVRGRAGAILAVQANEPNALGWNRMGAALLRDGEQTFEFPFYDGFSVLNLQASHVIGPVEILDIRAVFVAQPVSYRGAFSCSDAHLSRVWEVSRWLTQICQQTHHLDSPDHQEPICDPGDYLIESLNNYQAFHQPQLARQDLRKYAWLLRATKFKPFHTSYALLWLQMLISYYDYTGDAALVKELTPEIHDLLDQFARYRGKNGLLSEAPDYMFMDWVDIGGFGAHHPPAVIGQGYLTAFYYRALLDGIRVANQSHDAARAERYAQLRREISEAYNRELWDEKAGLYRDGKPFVTSMPSGPWLPADKDIETHSSQNNALAVLYDLAPPARQAPIMRRLMAADLNCQPYFMFFIFDALNRAGLTDEFAAPQMRRWKIQSDTQSFREMWNSGDYSHAWQCAPLYEMSARVLGVTPLAPGLKRIAIAPHPCDLTWARGIVPTPTGVVEVSWKQGDNRFELSATVPAGCAAQVTLPAGGRRISQVTVNGRRVSKFALTAQSDVQLEIGAGITLMTLTLFP